MQGEVDSHPFLHRFDTMLAAGSKVALFVIICEIYDRGYTAIRCTLAPFGKGIGSHRSSALQVEVGMGINDAW
jgi:hypothetical protein